MERLSTCYFCGAGPQETLVDRPVVPEAVLTDSSAQRTIALCPDCRAKFDRLQETIADAAGDGHQARLDTASDSLSILDDDPLDDVDATLSRSADADSSGDAVEDLDAAADVGVAVDDAAGASDRAPADPTTDAADAADGPAFGEEPASPSADAASAADEPITASTDGPDDAPADPTDESSSDDGGLAESTAAGDRSDEASADGGDPTGAVDDPTAGKPFDRQEYSRVVKLLQNREFPIELDTLYELARGAYDIDEDTTTEIVGSLIDRGVIEERGGKLFRA
ncbi:hypothetical protein [Halococcoides cellulosivorans]|uniref:Uncharacterized protein n=1 Tax=Halococcoides cellulosivorans TaxID=1679096 RepID=A0A2R4WZI0_9EURY|nr:hypothetical protein [Halococcoides cellulosivorans]AWB26953.1 hypothetical protein HARCEL1_04120 [Halococcoides cellulosivorans]